LVDGTSDKGDPSAVGRQSEGDGSPNTSASAGDQRRAPV
jgi:hypothetical protein